MPPFIPIGSVGVDVVPNARDIYARLSASILPDADRVGREAGDLIGRRIREGIRGSLTDPIRVEGKLATVQAGKAGGDAGGAFGRQMRTRLEAALRSLPDIKVGANTSEADSDLQALRVRLESLRDKRIGIDIDTEAARAEAEDIEQQLRRIGAISPNVQVRVDTAAAIAELERMREQIRLATLKPWEVKLEVDGGFGARLRASVQAAQESLPNINIDSNTEPARARIQGLRAELELLRDVRIGIDIDAGAASAKIAEIQAEFEAISKNKRLTVDVRVDAMRAAAELAAVQAQADALDRKRPNVRVNTNAGSVYTQLLLVAGALAVIAVPPAIGVASAALGSLTAAAATAAVGLGALALVAVPSIAKITTALTAQKAANDAVANSADKAGKSSGQQAVQAAQQALQMEGAQQSLTQAYRQAAQQREQALRQVSDAERAVGDAQQRVLDAERGVGDARKKVADAERDVASAREQAADRQVQAVARIVEADRKAASAAEDARIAVLDLARAQKDAADQLQDINDRADASALAQRRAVLRVEDAKAALDKAMSAGSKATARDRVDAQLAYDEAAQSLKEQTKENGRLADQVKAANTAGVAGSDLVTQAQKRLADAKVKVADADGDVTAAQLAATKTQIEGAQSIAEAQGKVVDASRDVSDAQRQVAEAHRGVADAQRGVADAQKHVAEVSVQAADQIASAQRGITSAQLSVASASESAAGGIDAAAVAAAKYQRALDAMNPATRGTYDAVLRLKDGFKAWSDSLSPAVMPLFTRFIDGLTASLPSLTPMVLAAASAVGVLMDKASTSFKSPWWTQFKADLVIAMPEAIIGTGVAFGNLFKGIAGIIGAFLPHMDSISSRMQTITGRFANWGANLRGNPAFEAFLDNAARNAPLLGDAFGQVAHALIAVSNALDPLRGPILETIAGVAKGLAWIAETMPGLIQYLVLFAIAWRAVNTALIIYEALSLLQYANPMTWIILGVVAVIAAVALLILHWDKVAAAAKWLWQEGIKPYFDVIAEAAMWLWREAIKPMVDGIVAGWNAVASGASWLWREILSPAFDGIATGAKILAAVVLTVLITPLVLAWMVLAGVATWLWREILSPVFDAIATGAIWLWENGIKPYFGAFWDILQWVGDQVSWMWRDAIKPAWDAISDAAIWLWNNGLKPTFTAIWNVMQWVGEKAQWLWVNALQPTFSAIGEAAQWMWQWLIKPSIDGTVAAFQLLASWAQWLWKEAIKPTFDGIGGAVSSVLSGIETAFENTKNAISTTWEAVSEIAAKPIRWVIDHVYSSGIKLVWDKIADVVGLPHLPEVSSNFATGGVVPGYTPGVDNTLIAVGGGEAILRPELTRALGADWVHGGNAAARAGGVGGAQQFLAQARYGGGFFLGGIVDSIGDAIDSIPSPLDAVKGLGRLVRGGLAAAAGLALEPLKSLINKLPGDGQWANLARAVPTKGIDNLLDKLKGDDEQWSAQLTGLGSIIAGNPGPVLEFAQKFGGTPYVWGGNRPGGFDCSGLTEYSYRTAGHYPLGRTTYDQVQQGQPIDMANAKPGDLVFEHFGGQSPSHVGFYARPGWIYDAPKPGDTVGPSPMANVVGVRRYLDENLLGGQIGGGVQRWAPIVSTVLDMIGQPQSLIGTTLRRMNQESGGDPNAVNRTDINWQHGTPSVGLMQVIGPTFRQYAGAFRDLQPQMYGVSTSPLANIYASAKYALAQYGSLPAAYDRAGGYASGGIVPRLYDTGGPLPPGVTLAYNGTGQQEQVYTAQVNRALLTLANRGANATAAPTGSAGPALNIENWHAAAAEDPRRTAEEMRALARVRGR